MRKLSSRVDNADLFRHTIELLAFFDMCVEEASAGIYVDDEQVKDAVDSADEVITATTNEDIITTLMYALDRMEKAGYK